MSQQIYESTLFEHSLAAIHPSFLVVLRRRSIANLSITPDEYSALLELPEDGQVNMKQAAIICQVVNQSTPDETQTGLEEYATLQGVTTELLGLLREKFNEVNKENKKIPLVD